GTIEQPEVHALSRKRVYRMRGIADQREALGTVRARVDHAQWERGSIRIELHRAEHAVDCRLELGFDLFRRTADQGLRMVRTRRPHDRASAVRERKKRDRTVGQEPLPRRLPMREL